MTKETTRQTKTNHNQTNHDQTKTNHQNQPPALPPRGLGRCPISKTVPLPYAVSRPIDLRRDAILWRPERPQWSMQMAAPGALKSAGVGLAGELRSLIRVENPRTPLKLNGRRDVQGRTNPPLAYIAPALRDIYREVTDKGPGGHILTGPIYVEGAEPGDTLEVRIRSIQLAIPYAYNAFRPGAGFLPDEFPYARTKIIPLDRERMIARFSAGIEIPLRPFFGSMGVAPPENLGRISSVPPWFHAGNIDNKEFVAGTTLFIPVHARGALFQVGDGHAGQGNGEVDITAL